MIPALLLAASIAWVPNPGMLGRRADRHSHPKPTQAATHAVARVAHIDSVATSRIPWAKMPVEAPAGIVLKPWSIVGEKPVPKAVAESDAYIHVSETRLRVEWLSFALEHEEPVPWLRHRVPVLVLVSGDQVRPAEAFVMTPCMSPADCYLRPMSLAGVIDPERVWRKRFHDGRMATVVFAGYPRGEWKLEDVVQVRLSSDAAPRTEPHESGGVE